VVIFSYFFEAGVGIATGLTLGFLPGLYIFKLVFRKNQAPVISKQVEKKPYKAVLND